MINRIKENIFLGFVEDNNDPKRMGRCKIRVHTVYDSIPVEDIPWATPYKDASGTVFSLPSVGKVVNVIFNNGNIYKPEYIFAEHYDINLENKLKSLSEDDYKSFSSVHFEGSTQIYSNNSEGLKFDHEFTNINLDKNGSINLNLRDNNSKVNIGSPDASQATILGSNFMEWLDKFVEILINNTALQAGGIPVTIMPEMADLLFEYQTIKDIKFLSKNVWLVNNNEVKEQIRDYIPQKGDLWKSTTIQNTLTSFDSIPYIPKAREETGRPGFKDSSIPNDVTAYTITNEAEIAATSSLATVDVSNYKNGQIPLQQMVQNTYLSKSLNGDAAYLLKQASDSLTAMMNAYNASTFDGKQKITFTDGYRSLVRQQKLYAEYGPGRAARPGTSNHGWGIAVDMYWGVQTKMYKDYEKRPAGYKHPVYKWFFENGWKWGWINPDKLRDDSGTDEWWHWEYHGSAATKPNVLSNRYNGDFTSQDVASIKSSGGNYPYA
jgi:LAS superfamily LD-carboxypeptidase LdcB